MYFFTSVVSFRLLYHIIICLFWETNVAIQTRLSGVSNSCVNFFFNIQPLHTSLTNSNLPQNISNTVFILRQSRRLRSVAEDLLRNSIKIAACDGNTNEEEFGQKSS